MEEVEEATAEPYTLGDYTLLKLMGAGSLGNSYLGEHRFTKKLCVIKVLPEELATDNGFIKRFEDEVRLLARLDHPGIAKIQTVSFSQGRYYLVTDAIVSEARESLSLAQYMFTRGKRVLDEQMFYDLALQIATALDAAHGCSIHNKPAIHRNLKMNNVVLRVEEGKKLRAYITDFGLSRIVGVGAFLVQVFRSVAESLEHVEGRSGRLVQRYPNPPIEREEQIRLQTSFAQSYACLAPEQKRLDRLDRVTPATDRYAFGMLLYMVLMGEPLDAIYPFPKIHVEGYSYDWQTLIQQCLQAEPSSRPSLLKAAVEAVRTKFVAPSLGPAPVPLVAPRPSVSTAPPALTVSALPTPTKEFSREPSKEPSREAPSETMAPLLRPTTLVRPTVDLDPARQFQVDPTISTYTPQNEGVVQEVEPLLTDMIVIRGGDYFRGSSGVSRDEMPCHQVTVSSFALDIHPVTNEQFVRFLETMGGEKDSQHRDIIRLRDSRIKRSGGKLNIESGYQKHPVVGVTWYGAILYANWVGKRLPTEAEWEIAASGAGAALRYPTGSSIEKHQANFFSSDTTPVMSYPASVLGLYDMAGNVYEWCHDWYAYNYYEVSVQEPANPKGPLQGVYRVLRGGCWKSLQEDLRCARRHRNNPGTVNSTYGFRCAADAG